MLSVPEPMLILLLLLALGLVSRNSLLTGSAAVLILLRLAGADPLLHLLGRYGISAGIFLLILAILVPVADGRISLRHFVGELLRPAGLVAVVVSAAAAYVAKDGVDLLARQPSVMVGLIVGSIVGVLLGGVPTGPLIAAGLTAILARFLD
ncbi:MAG: DUF441 family protein [Bacillota bacterium]|nr:DUF441 family protein [Bacillota bacterium]